MELGDETRMRGWEDRDGMRPRWVVRARGHVYFFRAGLFSPFSFWLNRGVFELPENM